MDQTQMMTIDGMPVAINGEKNLLELIRKVGVKMPTFCYHSDLSVYGACRMCMVENERGGLEAACSTPPRPGMNIRTNTERLRKYRKMILELLLADHCRDCTTCSNNGHCKLQSLAIRFNISDVRFPNTSPKPRVDDSSVCITRDASKCILCGDCVRVCDEIQAVGAIDFINRGSKMYIGTAFNKPLPETGCVGCGQCSLACPTGAIVVKNHVEQVWKLLDDPAVRVSVQVAPAVRVAIGREFGLSDGEDCMGKVVTALRHMGFDEVYDTSTAADLTVMEEAAEFVQKFSEGKTAQMPLFTSCCPAWIQFCEKKHPDILPYLSTCRSPMQMFASVLRAHNETKKDGVCYKHVAVMPCTAKKEEILRPESSTNGKQDIDYVLTTTELITMIRKSGIRFENLEIEVTQQDGVKMVRVGDIAAIEITEQTTLADYFVIATGNSNTQINALCGAVEKAMKEQAGEDPLRREGYRDGTWVLLDYGCVVIHVFSAEAREFYSLERLWHDGKPVDLSGVLTEN